MVGTDSVITSPTLAVVGFASSSTTTSRTSRSERTPTGSEPRRTTAGSASSRIISATVSSALSDSLAATNSRSITSCTVTSLFMSHVSSGTV